MKCLRCKSKMEFVSKVQLNNRNLISFRCIVVDIYVCDRCGYIEMKGE